MTDYRIKRHLLTNAEGDRGIVLEPPSGEDWSIEHVAVDEVQGQKVAYVTWVRQKDDVDAQQDETDDLSVGGISRQGGRVLGG